MLVVNRDVFNYLRYIKMLYLILYLCALSITNISAERQVKVKLPGATIDAFSENSHECIEETGAETDILHDLLQRQFDDSESSKKFYFCLFKKSGLSDDAGKFYIEEVTKILRNSDKKEEIVSIVRECNKIESDIPSDRLYLGIQCYLENTPIALSVNP